MNKVAIVTDTTACIIPEQAAKYDIEVVPVELIIEDESYRDTVDISPREFYELLRQAKKPPTTSTSSPKPYFEAYLRASRKAASILCITEPSRFSAMYNSAKLAKEMAKKDMPGTAIEVIECDTAAAGQGLVVLAAARTAASGRILDEVAGVTRSIMSRVSLFAALDTLHYLARSGRVPQAASLVNSLINIKPVFSIKHGEAHTIALPRTMKSAVNHMLKMMEQRVIAGQPLHAAVMHADAPDEAVQIQKRISSRFDCAELFIAEFTPVMGVHTGPGLLGIAFYNGEQI